MKKSTKYVIGIDPSGAYQEGKGTTGFAVYDRLRDRPVFLGSVYAGDYNSMEAYFKAVADTMLELRTVYGLHTVVSIDDFLVYAQNAMTFTYSKMETCQLLGYLKMVLYKYEIPMYIRPAVLVKKRWSNDVLAHRGYIKPNGKSWIGPTKPDNLLPHELDALRHAIHCGMFEIKEE